MKRLAIVGMPNTGKSTFFNRLTGSSSRVGNWPGVTIDLLSARIVLGGEAIEVIDLPGIYDLHGFSEDEQIVRNFLENNPVDLIGVVLNATQLDHQLPLALQICKLGIQPVILLNMIDEADQLGIRIDAGGIANDLQCPVHPLSARHGSGMNEVRETLTRCLGEARPRPLDDMRNCLHADDEIVRHSDALISRCVSAPSKLVRKITERIDRVLLHPWLGLPLFFAAMFLVFQAVYTLGGPLQDVVAFVLESFKNLALLPLASVLPAALYGFLINGLYDGIGTVASFVPIIILFFFMMAIVEDSGYLARAAFLTDSLMARMGLDGRGFVMILMGFGCNVPALMGTRVMRSRGLRWLTMLVVPFSLCSARLQVFVFITTALFSPRQAPVVLFFMYLASFAAAFLTAAVFGSRLKSDEPFVLELPPYRAPQLKQVLLRGWHEIYHFLRRASTFIVSGVVMVWLLTHYPEGSTPGGAGTWASMLGEWLKPVLDPIGISAAMSVVLLFGFVAKEIVIGAMVAMTGLEGNALNGYLATQMDTIQAVSFMLFILLYTPCLSTLATQLSESRSWKFAGISLTWSLSLAWAVSFVFYQGARALGF
ncbi:MAG TPA: ferrous iron transport protein B [Gammaproteobacteria bacterium]|nr:ferrous iron transport protein B [Gammaproteobacteria bacterium]